MIELGTQREGGQAAVGELQTVGSIAADAPGQRRSVSRRETKQSRFARTYLPSEGVSASCGVRIGAWCMIVAVGQLEPQAERTCVD